MRNKDNASKIIEALNILLNTLSESLIEPVYYNKYDIHDYAFELYIKI